MSVIYFNSTEEINILRRWHNKFMTKMFPNHTKKLEVGTFNKGNKADKISGSKIFGKSLEKYI